MTDWAIRVPHQHRDEPLTVVASHCRHLGDDSAAMFQLVIGARLNGDHTAGDLLDRLAGMDTAERRALLDQARAKAGLDAADTIDARERWQAIQGRPADTIRSCAEQGCGQYPCRPGGGFFTPNVKRWWCQAHEHLAEPGDMERPGCGLKIAPSGALVVDDPIDEARERRREETRRERHRVQAEIRVVEAAEYRVSKAKRDAAARSTLPEHLREPRLA